MEIIIIIIFKVNLGFSSRYAATNLLTFWVWNFLIQFTSQYCYRPVYRFQLNYYNVQWCLTKTF